MFSWFRKNKASEQRGNFPVVDIHSHLLPGLDDGVKSFEESEEIIRNFQHLGYTKLITTPHVMSDFYRNTNENIVTSLSEVNAYLRQKGIEITLEAAAEFYLDEVLVARIQTGDPLLTFGKNYFLFETNFMTEPLNLKEFIFLATTKGYKPILAHPERYVYLQNNFTKAEDLVIDKGYVHFLGSDCHNLHHIQLLEEARKSKYFQKAISLPLLNNTL